ncbi:MAG: class I adenylate-forming enzyme family protein [Halodesulfurarchaeum sp.]
MDEYLRRRARKDPDRTALVDGRNGTTYRYGDLDGWARRIAGELTNRGHVTGDRVALLMKRQPAAIAAVWGVFRAGGVVVPLDPDEPDRNLHSRCERAAVEYALHEPGTDRVAGSVPETGAPLAVPAAPSSGGEPPSFESRDRPLDATRAILFTSGTTGRPTGVRLTGRNLGASAASTIDRLGVESRDRWLLDLPIAHAGGLSIPIRTAMRGATTVLSAEFDTQETARTMRERDVTGVSLVPTMLDRLLEGPGLPDSLRFVLLGGAAAPPSLVESALAADVPLFASYGTTETASGVATATPAELRADPETVGRPVRAAEVSILGPENAPVDTGETGEIAVSGPIVSPGTLGTGGDRPREELHTGDRGALDSAGRLTVLGRIDDLIVTGGENVSPRTVEAAIRETLPVEDCAVLGRADEEWGQRVGAALVPETDGIGFSREGVRAALRGQLADHELPREVITVESLPRTASGTVDREALRAAFERRDNL